MEISIWDIIEIENVLITVVLVLILKVVADKWKAHKKKNTIVVEKEWKDYVLPHGPLVELSKGKLWSVTGKFTPDRNMIIYKTNDDKLIIHSAIVLDEKTQKQVELLGTPHVVIIPNRFHCRDAKAYKNRYPEIKVLCPLDSFTMISKKVDFVLDGSVERALATYVSSEEFAYIVPVGAKGELSYEVALGNGNKGLIVCDLMFNLPSSEACDWPGWIIGSILGSLTDGKQLRVSRLFRFLALTDKAQFKQWVSEQAKKSYKVVCVAHGKHITEQCQQKLSNVVKTL